MAGRLSAHTLLALAGFAASAFPARLVVTEFGADASGAKDSTAAVQSCLDRTARNGGGTVYVPPGTYRIGSLSIGANTRLELAGGAADARRGFTDEVRLAADDPSRSAIVRTSGKSTCSIFLYNLPVPSYCTNGADNVSVSGGVFDCQGRMKTLAFACGRNVRIENVIVKDIPNNHAFQLDGCENAVVTNCLFAGCRTGRVTYWETIQLEPTSPGAITGNPRLRPSPIVCAPDDNRFNRDVTIAGCWFGPSERFGPHYVAVGHHSRSPACAGFKFVGNVVVEPRYGALRLPDYSDVLIADNTFIATNDVPLLADDAAMISIIGGRARSPGTPAVRIKGNRYVLHPSNPRQKLHVSPPRRDDVLMDE